MLYIKHYPVNDFAYSVMLQESMNVLASNILNFDNPNVFEIIQIFNISLFFKDEQYLNEHGKNMLNTNKKYIPILKKTQSLYFKNINSRKIESDIVFVNDTLSI